MTSTDLMNVSAFENQLPDAAFAGLNPEAENLADGIGSSYGIVGYRGKVWSLRLRGETATFTRPDDGSPAAFLDVIVLRSASYKSKSYYPAGSFDQDSGGSRPVCAALDGVTPDNDVQERQSQACAICPRNEWKLNADGKKNRECSDYKRLAVLILPSQSKALLGAPLMEPVFLRVPAASLNDLAILGEAMSKKGFHFSTYITRIGFQPDKAHPQMTFRALQKLTAAEAPVVMPLREDPQSYRITGESEVGKTRPAALSQQSAGQQKVSSANTVSAEKSVAGVQANSTTATSPSKVETAKVVETKPAEDDEEAALMKKLEEARKKKAAAAAAAKPETVDTGFTASRPMDGEIIEPPAKAAVKQEVAAIPQSTVDVVDTGFGNLGAEPSPAAASPTANTTDDTGAAEDADVDLDARVAAMLTR